MTVITLPASLRLGDGSGMGQRRFDLVGSSDSTGAEQARIISPPRWTLRLVQPPALVPEQAATWRAVLLQMRGRVNRLLAPDPVRQAPRGTLRGTLTLAAGVAIGDTTLTLSGSTGTLLAGDLLQLGTGLGTSQLVEVVADGSHAGVTFEPPARIAFAGGVAVAWQSPAAYYRLSTDGSAWSYGAAGRITTGMTLDLIEAWT